MEEMGEVLAQERWDEGVPQGRWGEGLAHTGEMGRGPSMGETGEGLAWGHGTFRMGPSNLCFMQSYIFPIPVVTQS